MAPERGMSELEIHMFPCLTDNYGYLLHDAGSGVTAAVDTPDAEEIAAQLDAKGWRLTHILNTHHHGDHVGGNLALKEWSGCTIVGPGPDAARIPGIDVLVGDGDTYDFGQARAQVFFVPGHTRGHIAYWFKDHDALFCGDTLFALGCGRLFEGTPQQMWNSLSRLRALPDSTRVYCAHEYTQSNGRFALVAEPDNEAIRHRMADVDVARANGEPTIPTSIALELATNPFLRARDATELAKRRAAKDAF